MDWDYINERPVDDPLSPSEIDDLYEALEDAEKELEELQDLREDADYPEDFDWDIDRLKEKIWNLKYELDLV